MYDVNADLLNNRLMIILTGRIDIGELKQAGAKINQESKLLKTGFGSIIDFSEYVTGVIDARQVMLGLVHSLSELGLGKAICVVRDINAKDAMTPPQPEKDEEEALDPIEDPWEVALSVRQAEKLLDKYFQVGVDGVPTFTKRPTILLIDDELSLLTVLSNVIKRAGYNVHSAANGNRGIEQAKNLLPELIICDVMMPTPNGFRVHEILSEDPLTVNIPFIFLTARTAKGDTVFALKSGADDYITKPFDRGELLARIEAVLRRYQKNLHLK